MQTDLVRGRDADDACPERELAADREPIPQSAEPRDERSERQSSATPNASAVKRAAYPPAAEVPTQEGPFGIRYDFNQGARVRLPERADGEWLVRLSDLDTGNVLFETQ